MAGIHAVHGVDSVDDVLGDAVAGVAAAVVGLESAGAEHAGYSWSYLNLLTVISLKSQAAVVAELAGVVDCAERERIADRTEQ